jgi:hypothetical protein
MALEKAVVFLVTTIGTPVMFAILSGGVVFTTE